jgi:hypothetical protein
MPCSTRSRFRRVVRARDALAFVLIVACRRHEPQSHEHDQPAPAPAADVIRHTSGPIKIDGEWDEHDWPTRALRGQFVADDNTLARPSSEVRFLHDDKDLIVALYAADENIETRDAFDFSVGTLALHVDARGVVTPPNAAIRAKTDFDEGTIDNPKDDDEEWVVELAIPLDAVGLKAGVHQPVKASRCDTPKDNIQRCGHWSSSLTID